MTRSILERLRRDFSGEAKEIAGVFLLDARTSIRFVEACRSRGLEIAGVEGFKVIGEAVQPRQEDSCDYEGERPGRHTDCVAFLTKRLDSGLWFDVVVEMADE